MKIELEQNYEKKRVGILISKTVKFTRRLDLEENNLHFIIIVVMASKKLRTVNLYRSFRPQGLVPAATLFKKQLAVLEKVMGKNIIILGDFNLDVRWQSRPDYPHKAL